MSRDEQVYRLARPQSRGNRADIAETMSALIEEAHTQQRHGYASRHKPVIDDRRDEPMQAKASPMLPDVLQTLLREETPSRRLSDLVLPRHITADLKEFLSEYSQASLLRSHSLEPRHTMLVVGPPGTGKTTLASALAVELGLPFLTVRYDGLVGSFLGETAARLQQVIDYVSRTPCVLFFDEFESIGKERADSNETGEIKRVVSSLLLHMDAIPSSCVVVCATNHPELLDRAVWRRFELRMEIPLPGTAELKEWFMKTEKALGPLGISAADFVNLLKGESFSEIEAITLDARRKLILSKGRSTAASALSQAFDAWERRRAVGGVKLSGNETNRANKSGAGKRATTSRKKAVLPTTELLPGTEQPSRK
ncbi:ATPase family protein associated with various cellular activities (AAA) [Rhizobium mongolense USDA 1844]|uniref:ATPase family protein associated with various cellular activities (AAA) n=4 Tax=Rhizobium mongolense TaxID=57676 RepID=A0A559TJS5_9HYPH|nr:ATPase family protein associated with various cellular activities (AAA) [Rhizobium mongolense USDA 1844]